MNDHIRINHEELHAHAGHMDEVCIDIGNAYTSASHVNLHNGAFGVMCAWLPGVVEHFNPTFTGAIWAGSVAVSNVADAVREIADDFVDTDDYVAKAMKGIKP